MQRILGIVCQLHVLAPRPLIPRRRDFIQQLVDIVSHCHTMCSARASRGCSHGCSASPSQLAKRQITNDIERREAHSAHDIHVYSASAAALTLLLVRVDNPLHALLVASGRDPPPLIHLTSAGRPLPADIPPCRAADVRERNADYGAVAFVEDEDLEGEVSAEAVPDSWETCDGPEGGAGVGAERVEVEKVDGADEEGDAELGACQSWGPVELGLWAA